jgi:predicted component of type VI protein secretion system
MLALLVRVDNFQDNSTRSFAFGKTPVRIGRNALNDLPLAFPFVSQWHAVVAFDQANAAYYDLGSTNGTTVQGQRLAPNQPVGIPGPECEFRIGALRLTFQLANVPESMMTGAGNANADSTVVSAGLLKSTQARMPGATSGHPPVDNDVSSTMMIDSASLMAGQGPQATARPSMMGPARNQILALRPLYAAHRRAWQELQQGLVDVLSQVPTAQVPAAVALFAESYPEVAGEAQFKAIAQSQSVPLPGDPGGAAGQLVQQLAQYLVPSRPAPQSPQEMEGFLVRALAAMETFATAYVSLRRSQDEFGTEMVGSPRRSADPSPIEDPQDPRQVLEFLLDWTGDGDARMQQLRGQYAEIMTHQVALLGAVMEGVRKLLKVRLAPEGVLRHVDAQGGAFNFGPFKAAAAWRRYLALHDELTEDKEITSAIFGRDFARAYSAALGENFADNDPRRVPSGRGH